MGKDYWDSQPTDEPAGILLILYVDDVDAHWRQAQDAGATAPEPVDKPYAARVYSITDPGRYEWTIWQHLDREVSLEPGWQEIRAGES